MKRISKLKLCDIEVDLSEKLDDLLGKLPISAEYEKDNTALGIVLNFIEPYIGELHFDNEGNFIGYYTAEADGTGEYDNDIEITFENGNSIKGTTEEISKELCDSILELKGTYPVTVGLYGVHYGKTQDINGNTYVCVVSETLDDEEIITIIKEEFFDDFLLSIDGVDIAKSIKSGRIISTT